MRRVLLPVALVAVLAVAVAVLAVLAERQRQATAPPSAPDHGSARALTGAAGFDVAVSDVQVVDGGRRVTMAVTFHNSSSTQQRADPQDFTLRDASGTTARPAFDASCPRWTRADLHPAGGAGQSPRDSDAQQAGADFGPVPLCFAVAHAAGAGSTLVWDPDVGFFGAPVPIPLR